MSVLAPSRRSFLQSTLAVGGSAAIAKPAFAQTPSAIIAAAREGLQHAGGVVVHRDVVGVADFSQPSKTPRLHIVDIGNGRIESLLVAHGRGSDPKHTGWVKRFSNDFSSDATSEGCYLTGDYYFGQHGHAMRLKGLDPTNSNAEARGVVMHSAWYVSPDVARRYGVLGRSEGCLAVSQAKLEHVLQRLGPGRLIVARKL